MSTNSCTIRATPRSRRVIDGLEGLVHDNEVLFASKHLAARLGQQGRTLGDSRHRIELDLARVERETQN